MLIVGFGDIGAACGRIAKFGFGTKVIGVKRRPENTPDTNRLCADLIIGLDQINDYLPTADFVVSVLPNTPSTVNFFDKEKLR